MNHLSSSTQGADSHQRRSCSIMHRAWRCLSRRHVLLHIVSVQLIILHYYTVRMTTTVKPTGYLPLSLPNFLSHHTHTPSPSPLSPPSPAHRAPMGPHGHGDPPPCLAKRTRRHSSAVCNPHPAGGPDWRFSFSSLWQGGPVDPPPSLLPHHHT